MTTSANATQTQWTQGDWHLNEWHQIVTKGDDGSENPVLISAGVATASPNHPDWKEAIANRNLFVASPKLYSALSDLVDFIKLGDYEDDFLEEAEVALALARGHDVS